MFRFQGQGFKGQVSRVEGSRVGDPQRTKLATQHAESSRLGTQITKSKSRTEDLHQVVQVPVSETCNFS